MLAKHVNNTYIVRQVLRQSGRAKCPKVTATACRTLGQRARQRGQVPKVSRHKMVRHNEREPQ